MSALSAVYGAAATWRRRWYSAARSRHLNRPVISIGNLRVGGTGKTPVTAHVARLLVTHGERPVILSRGYARERATSGVTVVSDRSRVMADIAHAGDEPLLLARALPGVPVLVCADRYLAGVEAESRFEPSVHLLDDGFQHVKLARDLDLLLVDLQDLDDRVLPAGRLREPLANAAIADAVLVPTSATSPETSTIAQRLSVDRSFSIARRLANIHRLNGGELPAADAPWLAFAGIARPERFFTDLSAAGYNVRETVAFRDHHVFRTADIERLRERAKAVGAAALITTEKDAVRLPPEAAFSLPLAVAPLEVSIEPAADFEAWLIQRLADVRSEGAARR